MSKSITDEDRLAGRRSLGQLLGLLGIILATAFIGELVIMSLLNYWLPRHVEPWLVTLLDAGLLSLLLVAVTLPLMLGVRERYLRQARKSLRLQYTLDKHAIVSITDPAGTITFANDGFCDISGYAREELLGRNHRIMKSGLHDTAFYQDMWQALRAGRIWHGDICNRRRDGGTYWVRATITPFLDENGDIHEYVAIRTDITEQKELELASRRQEARMRMILDNLGEGVYTLDADGMVTYLNKEGERLLGWSDAELHGRPLHETVHHHRADGRLVPADECPIRRAMEANRVYRSGDEAFFRKDGSLLPVKITGAPLLVDGARLGSVAVFADASEEQRLKEHLLDAKRAAERAARLKSEFLSTISHEIRTPLNGVVGMTALLLDTRLDAEQAEFAQLIKTSADALMTIVDDVLDMSKIEAGRLEIEVTDFSLRQVVESTIEVLAGKATEKRLLLSSFVSPELPDHLLGDPTRIRQILLNFLSNAIKFTERGAVTISAQPAEGDGTPTDGRVAIRFAVRDTGIGLSAAESSSLFQPFVQSDSSTTRKYGGTGLGLSICKHLASAMGGTVGVDSRPGEGSCFHVRLPILVGEEKRHQKPLTELLAGRRILLAGSGGGAEVWGHYLVAWNAGFDLVSQLAEMTSRAADAASSGQPYAAILLVEALADGDVAAAVGALDPRVPRASIVCGILHPGRELKARLGQLGVQLLQGPLRQSALLNLLRAILDSGQAVRGRRAEDVEAASHGGLVRGDGQRLLLAEDNKVNQQVASQMLLQLGYSVDVANDGVEAVDAAARGFYQLVLMDCQMPRMDGFAATRAIREAEAGTGRHLPIVAMTANVLDGDRQRCIDAGMDDYLSKPIEVSRLADTIATWLGRGHSNRMVAGRSAFGNGNARQAADRAVGGDSPIDMLRLNQICSFDEEDVQRLLVALDESLREAVPRLEAANTDIDAVSREIGHELRGLAQNVGATRLGQLAGELELQAKHGRPLDIAALIPQVVRECDRISRFIAGRVERQKV